MRRKSKNEDSVDLTPLKRVDTKDLTPLKGEDSVDLTPLKEVDGRELYRPKMMYTKEIAPLKGGGSVEITPLKKLVRRAKKIAKRKRNPPNTKSAQPAVQNVQKVEGEAPR
jgi:hypothetical protein